MTRKKLGQGERYWEEGYGEDGFGSGETDEDVMDRVVDSLEGEGLGYGQHNGLLNATTGLLKETSKDPDHRDVNYITEKVRAIERNLCGMAHDGMLGGRVPSFCKETGTGVIRKKRDYED